MYRKAVAKARNELGDMRKELQSGAGAPLLKGSPEAFAFLEQMRQQAQRDRDAREIAVLAAGPLVDPSLRPAGGPAPRFEDAARMAFQTEGFQRAVEQMQRIAEAIRERFVDQRPADGGPVVDGRGKVDAVFERAFDGLQEGSKEEVDRLDILAAKTDEQTAVLNQLLAVSQRQQQPKVFKV